MPIGSGWDGRPQPALHVSDRIVAKVADQASVESWQAFNQRYSEPGLVLFYEGEWVFGVDALDYFAVRR